MPLRNFYKGRGADRHDGQLVTYTAQQHIQGLWSTPIHSLGLFPLMPHLAAKGQATCLPSELRAEQVLTRGRQSSRCATCLQFFPSPPSPLFCIELRIFALNMQNKPIFGFPGMQANSVPKTAFMSDTLARSVSVLPLPAHPVCPPSTVSLGSVGPPLLAGARLPSWLNRLQHMMWGEKLSASPRTECTK